VRRKTPTERPARPLFRCSPTPRSSHHRSPASSRNSPSPHRRGPTPTRRRSPPSATVSRPPPTSPSSSLDDISPLELDTEGESVLRQKMEDLDVAIVGGMDRHSDCQSPESPRLARRLDDAVRSTVRRPSEAHATPSPPGSEPSPPAVPSSASAAPSSPADLSSPPGAEPSAAAPPLVSTLSPWAAPFVPASTASASQDASHDDVEDVNLQDAPRVAPQRPQLRLSDLVAAVLHTNASQVSAVAAHLEAGFSFDLSRESLQLILVCMYTLTQRLMGLTDSNLLRLAYEMHRLARPGRRT